jgi:hypothetical protein
VLAVLFTSLGLSVEWIYGALLADYVVKSVLLIARFRSGRWQHAIAPTLGAVVPAPASVHPAIAAD